jgi:membrane-associated phospholipid phosphatase
MRISLRQHKWFYFPYFFILASGFFFVIFLTKSTVHLWLNQYHTIFFDYFFKHVTYLGDGSFLPFFFILMLFIRFRFALLLVIVFVASGLFVQVLKRFIFMDMARPTKYLGEAAHLYLIPGVQQYCCNSFPSGHSATAFGIFLCFALISEKNWVKILMMVFACLVAYSRVYLSQHFLIDILSGSIIGVITATLLYTWIYSLKAPWLNNCFKITLHNKS